MNYCFIDRKLVGRYEEPWLRKNAVCTLKPVFCPEILITRPARFTAASVFL